MHNMCVKCRARQDGKKQQGPEGGGEIARIWQCVCVFVWWGSRGAARTQWDICIGSIRMDLQGGCIHGTQANKQGTTENWEITRQIPKAKGEDKGEGAAPEQR